MKVVRYSAADATCELALPAGPESVCSKCGGCSSAYRIAEDAKTPLIGIAIPPATTSQQSREELKIGQSIEMEVPAAMLLLLSSVVYLLPVVLMLSFAVGCDLLFGASEVQVAVSAVIGLGVGLFSIVLFRPALRLKISTSLTLTSA